MKLGTRIIVFFLIAGSISCQNPIDTKTKDRIQHKTDSTAYILDQRLKQVDSLVLVFYKDPYGRDSLRYTRYYKQVGVVGGLEAFKAQLSAVYTKQGLRKCRSEGKIWCFAKGKVYQTIYFSTFCNDCCFTYLIRDGDLYYSTINTAFVEWLRTQQKKAVELPNQGEKPD